MPTHAKIYIYQLAHFGIYNTITINAKNFHTLVVQINIGEIIVSMAEYGKVFN